MLIYPTLMDWQTQISDYQFINQNEWFFHSSRWLVSSHVTVHNCKCIINKESLILLILDELWFFLPNTTNHNNTWNGNVYILLELFCTIFNVMVNKFITVYILKTSQSWQAAIKGKMNIIILPSQFIKFDIISKFSS